MVVREVENTFEVPEFFEVPDLTYAGPVCAVDAPRQVRLSTVYYDTHDLRLAREGITLRRHEGGDDEGWHLALPGSARTPGAGVRDELRRPLADGCHGGAASEGSEAPVPPELADLVTAYTCRSALEAMATLRTDRQVRVLRRSDGSAVGELVLDEVSVIEAGFGQTLDAEVGPERILGRFRELELDERPGDGDGDGDGDGGGDGGGPARTVVTDGELRKVVRRLLAAGATTGTTVPKVVRALGPQASAPPPLPMPAKVSSSAPASDLVAAHITRQVRALRQADLGVRLDEAGAVHQMRVAARRLRSGLRVFRPLLDRAWADDLRAELGWLAGELGRARDGEVLAARLAGGMQVLPAEVDTTAAAEFLREHFARDADAGRRDALAALRSARYALLVEALVAAANSPATTPAARQSAAVALPVLVSKAWRRLAREAQALQLAGHDDDWHQVRKSAKAVRYAAEAVAPVVGRPAKDLARQIEAITETLGEHQDAAVAAHVLTQMIRSGEFGVIPAGGTLDAEVTFALGVLYGQQRENVHRARLEFLSAWADASRARHRAWLPTKG